MLNSFFQAICRVGIFMICAQAIMHFKAKESYEKYLKLLVSTMILIQLFLPIGNLLAGKGGLQAEDVMEQFKREVEQGMRTAEENAAAADAILEQMTLEQIRNYMETQSKESMNEEKKNEEGKNRDGETANERRENGDGETANERRENEDGEEENIDEEGENRNGEGENGNRIEIEVEEIESISIGMAAPLK